MSKEKTKVCKYCKEEIDAKAKVCPHWCEYVAVDFTCENIAEKGDKYVSVSDCECYADNSACEQQYIGDSDFVNTNLSPGKNVSFTAYYEVPKDAKKVILEYSASFWTDKKITINLK